MSWLWSFLQLGSEMAIERTWRDYFTWSGWKFAIGHTLSWARNFLGFEALSQLASILTFLLALRWLHGLSLRDALAKLGLPKPKRVEIVVPLVAALPSFVWVFLCFRPGPSMIAEQISEAYPGLSFAIMPPVLLHLLGTLLSWTFLYKGLSEDAGWPHSRILLLLCSLETFLPVLWWLSFGEIQYSWTLPFVMVELASLLASAWLLVHWGMRIWCLLVLALGFHFTYCFVPWSGAAEHWYLQPVLRLQPILLLGAWTWFVTRRQISQA